MATPPFRHRFTVRLHDTDAAGVFFYAHLFRHTHDAYEAFMEALGFPLDTLIRDADWHLPIVHTEADYRHPIGHGERLTALVEVAQVGRSAFTLAYQFSNPGRQTVANASTVHVAVGAADQRSTPLPEDLARALRKQLTARAGRGGPSSQGNGGRAPDGN